MIDLWKKMVHRFPSMFCFGLETRLHAYVLSLALQAAKFPADVSAVTEKTMGTGWSDKVAVSVCLCFRHNILASEQTRHDANPCQQDTDTLGFCLQLRIKGEAFKWIQDFASNLAKIGSI